MVCSTADGQHTISARAVDTLGNVSAPATVTVNVANAVVQPPPPTSTGNGIALFRYTGVEGTQAEMQLRAHHHRRVPARRSGIRQGAEPERTRPRLPRRVRLAPLRDA
jgi:hypothetical protein